MKNSLNVLKTVCNSSFHYYKYKPCPLFNFHLSQSCFRQFSVNSVNKKASNNRTNNNNHVKNNNNNNHINKNNNASSTNKVDSLKEFKVSKVVKLPSSIPVDFYTNFPNIDTNTISGKSVQSLQHLKELQNTYNSLLEGAKNDEAALIKKEFSEKLNIILTNTSEQYPAIYYESLIILCFHFQEFEPVLTIFSTIKNQKIPMFYTLHEMLFFCFMKLNQVEKAHNQLLRIIALYLNSPHIDKVAILFRRFLHFSQYESNLHEKVINRNPYILTAFQRWISVRNAIYSKTNELERKPDLTLFFNAPSYKGLLLHNLEHWKHVQLLLHQMQEDKVIIYSNSLSGSILNNFNLQYQPDLTIQYYNLLLAQNMDPNNESKHQLDSHIYSAAIRGYGLLRDLSSIDAILARLKNEKIVMNQFLYASLLLAYGECKEIERIDKIWKELQSQEIYKFDGYLLSLYVNSLLGNKSLIDNGDYRFQELFSLYKSHIYHQLMSQEFNSNELSTMAHSYYLLGLYDEMFQIIRHTRYLFHMRTSRQFTVLIEYYCKQDVPEQVIRLLKEVEKLNLKNFWLNHLAYFQAIYYLSTNYKPMAKQNARTILEGLFQLNSPLWNVRTNNENKTLSIDISDLEPAIAVAALKLFIFAVQHYIQSEAFQYNKDVFNPIHEMIIQIKQAIVLYNLNRNNSQENNPSKSVKICLPLDTGSQWHTSIVHNLIKQDPVLNCAKIDGLDSKLFIKSTTNTHGQIRNQILLSVDLLAEILEKAIQRTEELRKQNEIIVAKAGNKAIESV